MHENNIQLHIFRSIKRKNIDLPIKVKLKHKNSRVRKNERILSKGIDERPENINNGTEVIGR